jgi:hypothetical protein
MSVFKVFRTERTLTLSEVEVEVPSPALSRNILEVEMTTHERHIAWYLWPFAAIWKLLAVTVEMTGRFIAMILGILLMIVGVLVSLTIVGAIIGVPLGIVGLLLFLKGIF